MKRLLLLLFGLALVAPVAAGAVEPDEILSDVALEARARALSAGLRCLVCQNESIDESQAPLARDLRQIVRERLQAGDSDAAITRLLRARYGDFILLKPPFAPGTLLLWGTPALVLLCGAAGLAWTARRRPAPPEGPLAPTDAARLQTLLDEVRRNG